MEETDEVIRFGIGFITGRPNVCKVINNTYKHLLNQIKKSTKSIDLSIYILFDLNYEHTTRVDFYGIVPDVYKNIKIKYITPEEIEAQKEKLVEEKVLSREEATLFLGYGYAKARNTLLYNALKDNIDYLLFWDDDEYPVACIKDTKSNELKWVLQDNILKHIDNITDAEITFGRRCGYNSPIPYIDFESDINKNAIKCYIEAVQNEFTDWEHVKQLMLCNGIDYADEKIANNQDAKCIENNVKEVIITGSPLCINLRRVDKIPAFYNPEGARGEDTFFSLSIKEGKIITVPVYHFHDPFLKYTGILRDRYPKELKNIKTDTPAVLKRFYNASRGWIRYRPLYLYITDKEHYKEQIELTRKNLKVGIPEINKIFNNEDFGILLKDLDIYDKNVEIDYQNYIKTNQIWKKLKDNIRNNK